MWKHMGKIFISFLLKKASLTMKLVYILASSEIKKLTSSAGTFLVSFGSTQFEAT